MRKILMGVAAWLLLSAVAYGRTRIQGDCSQGNNTVTTAGVVSTTKVMQSFPACTVTVYLVGTTTPATIYSNVTGTPLSTPFTADSTGHWFFYADTQVDVQLSGAGIGSPFTLGDLPWGSPLAHVCSASAQTGANAGAQISSCISSI